MERRRELRSLALPFMVSVGQRPAWNGGRSACQQQMGKEVESSFACCSLSATRDEEASRHRFKMIGMAFHLI
jgi:hypothetical protein